MRFQPVNVVTRVARGVGRALWFRPKVFAWVAVGVFALNLVLPLLVLSLARKPFDLFTFNPWLSRLPEWLASPEVPWGGKVAFLSDMAIAWFIAENPIDGWRRVARLARRCRGGASSSPEPALDLFVAGPLN